MYELQQHFSFEVSPSRDGKVTLTLEMDAIHVKTFLTMLESLSSFFRVVNNKAKVALAYVNQPKAREQGAKYYAEFCSAVLDTFKQLRHERPELTPQDLISYTAKLTKLTYPNSSYNTVRDVLRSAGELKKCGYYKKDV